MAEEELKTKFLSAYAENIENGLYEEEDVARVREGDTVLLGAYIMHLKGAVDEAVPHMDAALQWRKSFGVKSLTDKSFPKNILDQNVIFFSNTDKKGDTILHIQCVKMKKDAAYTDTAKKLLVSRIEQHYQAHLGQRLVVLYDMSGTGLNNVDTDFIRFLIACFSSYYPACLSYLLLVEMPWILSAVWQVVKKWLSAEQQKHVRVMKKAALDEFISKDQLFVHLGGNCTTIQDPGESKQLTIKSTNSTPSKEHNSTPPSPPSSSPKPPPTPPSPEPLKQEDDMLRIGDNPNDKLAEKLYSSTSSERGCAGSTDTQCDELANKLYTTPMSEKSFDKMTKMEEYRNPTKMKLKNDITSVFVNPLDYLEFDPVQNITSIIYITNRSESRVAFKIKSTKPEIFKVKPHIGVVQPSSTLRIACTAILGSKLERLNEKMMVSLVMLEGCGELGGSFHNVHELWSSLPRSRGHHADYKIACKLDEYTLEYLEARKKLQQEMVLSRVQAEPSQLNELKHLLIITMLLSSFPILSAIFLFFRDVLTYLFLSSAS